MVYIVFRYPSMHIVHGEKKVEELIKKELSYEIDKFRKRIKGKESKSLFVLLQSLNYLVGERLSTERDGLVDKIDPTIYRLFVSFRAMVDILLQSRISTVQMVSNNEFLNIFSILGEHLRIGLLSHMLYIQKKYPVSNVKIEAGLIVESREEPSELYEAFQSWVDIAGLDANWINWYFSRFREKRAKVGSLLRKEFKKTYGIELDDLTNISEYFKGVSEEHVKETKWSVSTTPFLFIKRKKIKKEFSKHMTQRDTQKWLRLLVYRPGKDLYKSPLIPLKFRGQKIYSLMTWVFTPSNHFWGAWITDMLLDHLQLSSRGKWAEQYGKAFQSYVDEMLNESKLPITNLGSRKILLCDHPEIKSWLDKLSKKEGFEIDRLIKYRDILFVVSCKARDFLYDRKVVRRGVFFPKVELQQRLMQNLEDMKEVYLIADCLKSCDKMRKRLNLSADKFAPVLLTSMREPLSSPEVRSYYSKTNEKQVLPNVYILTTSQFIGHIKEHSY